MNKQPTKRSEAGSGSRLALVVLIIFSFLVIPSCIPSTGIKEATPTTNSPSQQFTGISQGRSYQIIIQDISFVPQELDIKLGDLITWINEDRDMHTITSWHQYLDKDQNFHTEIGKIWDSGDIKPDQSFSRTFDQLGTFEYISLPIYFYTEFQARIVGVIVVS